MDLASLDTALKGMLAGLGWSTEVGEMVDANKQQQPHQQPPLLQQQPPQQSRPQGTPLATPLQQQPQRGHTAFRAWQPATRTSGSGAPPPFISGALSESGRGSGAAAGGGASAQAPAAAAAGGGAPGAPNATPMSAFTQAASAHKQPPPQQPPPQQPQPQPDTMGSSDGGGDEGLAAQAAKEGNAMLEVDAEAVTGGGGGGGRGGSGSGMEPSGSEPLVLPERSASPPAKRVCIEPQASAQGPK